MPRELAAAGHSRAQIARHMAVSEYTVVSHGRNVYGKFGVHSRLQLLDKLQSM